MGLEAAARRRSARLGGDTPEREEGEPGHKDLEGRCPGAVGERGATTPRARAPRGSGKAERVVRPEGRREAEPARRPGAAPLDPSRDKDSKTQDSIQSPGNSETAIGVAESGVVAAAIRGAQISREAPPRAATHHP